MHGDTRLEALTLRTPNGDEERKTSSVFIFIGRSAEDDWLPKEVLCDAKGFVLAGPDLKQKGISKVDGELIHICWRRVFRGSSSR